ncbi:hypothetical protein B0H13DRAFT_1963094 [Mycena leptocephala]|nr:hypothetical protein B0H13DRAFT_1963094 [Mycena leptocephala]
MAAELPSTQVMSIARPAIRPQTRTKVIEILAGNANGCLQELGYSPGLLERNRYLDDACTKLQTANQQLLTTNQQLTTLSDALKRDNKALRAFLEQLTDKCKTYQEENVKLYEDNTKLVSEVRTHEEMSGQDISVIVGQYALLKNQYADAVKELQLRTTQMVSMAANANASAPQPAASGSNTPREIRPVPGECSLSHCRLGLLTRRYQWSLYRYRPSVFHFAERSLSMHF